MAEIDLKRVVRQCFAGLPEFTLVRIEMISDWHCWAGVSFVKPERLTDSSFWERGVCQLQFDWHADRNVLTIGRFSDSKFPWGMRDIIRDLALKRCESGSARNIALVADIASDQLRIGAHGWEDYRDCDERTIIESLREYMPTFMRESSTSFLVIGAQVNGYSIEHLESTVSACRT